MSWADHHKRSEQFASQAEVAVRTGRHAEALPLYALAADAERQALADLDLTKTRTVGITAVSAAALYCKAEDFARSAETARRWLKFDALPADAKGQLNILLQAILERTRQDGAAPLERAKTDGSKMGAP